MPQLLTNCLQTSSTSLNLTSNLNQNVNSSAIFSVPAAMALTTVPFFSPPLPVTSTITTTTTAANVAIVADDELDVKDYTLLHNFYDNNNLIKSKNLVALNFVNAITAAAELDTRDEVLANNINIEKSSDFQNEYITCNFNKLIDNENENILTDLTEKNNDLSANNTSMPFFKTKLDSIKNDLNTETLFYPFFNSVDTVENKPIIQSQPILSPRANLKQNFYIQEQHCIKNTENNKLNSESFLKLLSPNFNYSVDKTNRNSCFTISNKQCELESKNSETMLAKKCSKQNFTTKLKKNNNYILHTTKLKELHYKASKAKGFNNKIDKALKNRLKKFEIFQSATSKTSSIDFTTKKKMLKLTTAATTAITTITNNQENEEDDDDNDEDDDNSNNFDHISMPHYPFEMYTFGEMYTDADSKCLKRRGPRTSIRQEQVYFIFS